MAKLLNNQIAAVNTHWRLYPFARFLEAQEMLGMESIELWAGAPHFHLDDESFDNCEKLKQEVAAHGLSVVAFSPECVTYPYPICTPDEITRKRSLAYYTNAIIAASKLGAQIMPVSCAGARLDDPLEEAFDNAVTILRDLSGPAAEYGVCLAVETLPQISAPILNTLPELKKLLDAVNSAQVQASLDICAVRTAGETIDEWLHLLGKIRHIHFTDGRPGGRMVWGQGLHPLDDYVESICNAAYTGYLGLNINNRGNWFDPALVDEEKGFVGESWVPENDWFAPAAADRENIRMILPYLSDREKGGDI